jgi:hypothetical protein
MASFGDRISAYLSLIRNSASESFNDQLDFAIQRTNFQGNDAERHIYQSFRALKSFLSFAGFSAVSCTCLSITKIANMKPNWSLDTHFKFCLMMGFSYSLLHRYFAAPLEVRHILTTPNSSYTKVSYAVLEGRDDKDLWMTAFNLPAEPQIESDRMYYAVPNFQHSGHSAVICVNPSAKQYPSVQYLPFVEPLIPIDGVQLDQDEFMNDITETNRLFISTRKDSPLKTAGGGFDDSQARSLISRSIASYCNLHDISMPSYFRQFDSFHEEQLNLERPVNFLHLYRDDDKKVRGHLPAAFQSPMDLVAVHKSRAALQEQVNQQAREFWDLQKQQDITKEQGHISTPVQQQEQVQ